MQLQKLHLLAAGILLLTASCNSSDNNSTTNSGDWTLNGTNYGATSVSKSGNSISGSASSGTDGFTVKFGSTPASGSYNIVSYFKTTLAANEATIEVDHGVSDVWLSTGNDNQKATVVAQGTEVKVTVPTISVRHANSSGPQADSTTASGGLDFVQ